jgi:plastocyanin
LTYIRLTLVDALGVLALLAPGAVGASSSAPTQPLVATVGDPAVPEAYRITLRDAAGNPVSHVDPGTYTITVHDYATTHNFHLTGPGVDQASDIEGTTTTTTWVVTFGNGTYTYVCDAHPTQMKGAFTSGTVVTKPKPKRLNARVGPGKKISLTTTSGAKVKRVTAGSYRITVRDTSRADNFHLIGPGVNKKTSVKGKSTSTWSVRFRSGPVRYRSDATKRLSGSFSVIAAG